MVWNIFNKKNKEPEPELKDQCSYLKFTFDKDDDIQFDFHVELDQLDNFIKMIVQLNTGVYSVPIFEKVFLELNKQGFSQESVYFMSKVQENIVKTAKNLRCQEDSPVVSPLNVFKNQQ